MQYQLMPDLTQDEFEALKADIAKRGVQVPVEYDDEGNVLDGHHRIRACEELGIDDWPSIIRGDLSEDEKVGHVLALNLARRHLTREQRRDLVVKLRQEGWSYPRIGEKLGVSDVTAMRDVRDATSTNEEVEMPDEVVGKDGKTRSATKPIVAEGDAECEEEPSVEEETGEAWQNIHRSESNEWYTPEQYIASARTVMGGIDVDPASNDAANEVVQATTYYTAETDGLQHEWPGRVWLNPPWGGAQAEFAEELVRQFEAGIVTEAIVLVNAHATETTWFAPFWDHTLCFTDHRINFYGTEGSGSTHGSVFVYLGPNWRGFTSEFEQWGAVVRRVVL